MAYPRTTKVSVCVPAIPPMLATVGITRTTTLAILSSNRLITAAAISAVMSLMPSQTARLRPAQRTGAKVSWSTSRPAGPTTVSSASSKMPSTSSSMVTRPNKWPASSTTGAEIRSCSQNKRATSVSDLETSMGSSSLFMISRTVTLGSAINSLVIDSKPRYSSRLLTTMSASVVAGSSRRRRRDRSTNSAA